MKVEKSHSTNPPRFPYNQTDPIFLIWPGSKAWPLALQPLFKLRKASQCGVTRHGFTEVQHESWAVWRKRCSFWCFFKGNNEIQSCGRNNQSLTMWYFIHFHCESRFHLHFINPSSQLPKETPMNGYIKLLVVVLCGKATKIQLQAMWNSRLAGEFQDMSAKPTFRSGKSPLWCSWYTVKTWAEDH